MSWLNRAARGIQALAKKRDVPENLWQKCPGCAEVLYRRELDRSLWVCGACGHHLPFTTEQYIALLIDAGTWQETHRGITSEDPLRFKDSKRYRDRIRASMQQTGKEDAVVTGTGRLEGRPVNLAVLDFAFMGGSMGSAMGEKIARMLLDSLQERRPAMILSRSGGARMQESLLSLMQLAKTAAVLGHLREARVPFVSILTHPTYGGVTASFGSLGDINLAEPGAMVGFAGPRVIKQTIGGELPDGFQSAEFLLAHGQLDLVVERHQLKDRLALVMRWCADQPPVARRGSARKPS